MFRAFFLMSEQASRSIRRRIRFRLEVLLFRFASWAVPLLSRGAVVRLSRWAGRLGWWVARRDRRIALANLDLAYGASLKPSRKREIVRHVMSTFILTGLDYFWFSRNRTQRLEKWVVVEESLRPWMRKGALIAVTAHYGNWEILGWMTVYHGSRLASVAKPVKNPLIDDEINRFRRASGQLIVPREGAIRPLVRVLREEGTVALLLDQDTLPAEGGVFVPFFGVPVPVATAAAGLALKLKVPMLLAFCTSDQTGRYHCYAPQALTPQALEGLTAEAATERITGLLEREIRNHPEYWLWTYKRWKRRMPGIDPARYPFYADC